MKCFVNILVFICLCLNLSAKDVPYHFGNTFKITISDKLELRKDGDFYTKILADSNIIPRYNSTIVFQQKGLSDIVQKSFNTYCRIMIQVIDCEDDETYSADCSVFSTDDYDFFIETAYNNIAPPQKMVKNPVVDVLWQNGYNYVKVSYIRTGIYGNVEVAMYDLFNLKKAVMMTTSYNIPDADKWKNIVEKAFKSFRWDTVYTPVVEIDIASQNSQNTVTDYDYGYNQTASNNTKGKAQNKPSIAPMVIIFINVVILLIIVAIRSSSKSNNNKRPSSNNTENSRQPSKSNIATSMVSYEESKPEIKYIPLTPIVTTPKTPTAKKSSSVATSNEELRFVNYTISGTFDNSAYAITKIPTNGTILYPFRRKKAQLRGYMEESFEAKLKKSLPKDCNFNVLGDVSIVTTFSSRPYEPDIAIIENEYNVGLRIDIEIDEPYSATDRTPIHYIGCGDEYRDKVFNNLGWLVIRFSEKQVFLESDKCISYIQGIMAFADKTFHRSVPMAAPSQDKRWTKSESIVMIAEKYREKLLNHNFGSTSIEPQIEKSFRLNEAEKNAQKLVKPVEIKQESYSNIDGSNTYFERDASLVFEPLEHIYRYGDRLLTPVSTFVAMFFKEFDSLSLSSNKTNNIQEQVKLIESWESNGAMAREVGTQLHLAIEKYFKNEKMPDSYHFTFSGRYVNIDEKVSIATELKYFRNFIADNKSLVPFRTEWRICDLQYGIAGTIDFICRNGSSFDIYDWKRSKKTSPDEKIYRYGRNGLSSVPDISYWHYALQQNLYRYILEKNYGLKVNKMHLVILHPEFSNYRIYEIPKMDSEINNMFNYLKYK